MNTAEVIKVALIVPFQEDVRRYAAEVRVDGWEITQVGFGGRFWGKNLSGETFLFTPIHSIRHVEGRLFDKYEVIGIWDGNYDLGNILDTVKRRLKNEETTEG